MKTCAEHCERNKDPILAQLRRFADKPGLVLEIGSGTGQHAVYFAQKLPHLIWQPSDLETMHAGIQGWLDEVGLPNIRKPLLLDLDQPIWPIEHADYVYTANTCHIVSWHQVAAMFRGTGSLLRQGGMLIIYGPFHYGGKHVGPNNPAFDTWLRQRDPKSGIRDFQAMQVLAAENGLVLVEDCPMPANNRLLIWRKP